MYKEDLALNNLQWLICHKTKPKQTKLPITMSSYHCVNLIYLPQTGMYQNICKTFDSP